MAASTFEIPAPDVTCKLPTRAVSYERLQLLSQDECGPELLSTLKSITAELIVNALPPNTNILKHHNAATALYQAQDFGKGHQTTKKFAKSGKECLQEGIDDERIPHYMIRVFNILKVSGFKPSAQRAYYMFFDESRSIAAWRRPGFDIYRGVRNKSQLLRAIMGGL